MWSEWEGRGIPHAVAPRLDPVLLCCLPARGWSVGRPDSVFRQKPWRPMQVSARPPFTQENACSSFLLSWNIND